MCVQDISQGVYKLNLWGPHLRMSRKVETGQARKRTRYTSYI